LPLSLVYVEQCESLSAALKRERQLKPWSRAKKKALIARDQQALKRA
jgi:putative endonuclease